MKYHLLMEANLSRGYITSVPKVRVSVILDPLTEPTQRVAPLLLAIRDVLKLPLRLIIAPRHVVDNDVPLSSYYRFVADPLASASNPPKARFENLPANHLLTLRMDVPEPWDVQQAYGVQDADNLRCDARFGCGDEGYILARDGSDDLVHRKSKGLVELAQIDYSLKSLLLFGQCYDVSKNTPPNGLQLALDRMSLGDSLPQIELDEFSIEPDGSIGSQSDIIRPSKDHADTLVMKTAGYFQLRSNPGVWKLRIEEKSRGSEIYHFVDSAAQVSPSIERKSKTLVVRDFTSPFHVLLVKRRKGFEKATLYLDDTDSSVVEKSSNETVHVFSLATGHAYERLLKIMMLSVTRRTSSPVKFWLFENVSRGFPSYLEIIEFVIVFSPIYRCQKYCSSFLLHLSRQQPSWPSILDAKLNSSLTNGLSGSVARVKSNDSFGATKFCS